MARITPAFTPTTTLALVRRYLATMTGVPLSWWSTDYLAFFSFQPGIRSERVDPRARRTAGGPNTRLHRTVCGSDGHFIILHHGGRRAQEIEQQGHLREDGVRTAGSSATGTGCHLGLSDNRHRGRIGVHGVRGLELHRRPLHDGDHPDHGRVQGGAYPRYHRAAVDHASPRNGGRHALLRSRLLRGARGGGRDTRLLREEENGGGHRKTERAPDPVRLRPGRPPGGGGVRPRRRTLRRGRPGPGDSRGVRRGGL